MANEVSRLNDAHDENSGTSRLLREEGPRKRTAGGNERVRETIGSLKSSGESMFGDVLDLNITKAILL